MSNARVESDNATPGYILNGRWIENELAVAGKECGAMRDTEGQG